MHALNLPADAPPAVLQAAAIAVYTEKRAAAAQLSFDVGHPRNWGSLVRLFFSPPAAGGESFASEETRSQLECHSRQILVGKGELGPFDLAQLMPPAGNLFLDNYVAALEAKGYAWKTRKHRISALKRLCRWAYRRGYILQLPQWPCPAPGMDERTEREEWVTEEQFWQVMAHLVPVLQVQAARGERNARLRVLDAQGFYAWAFYTGQHLSDCRNLRHGIDVDIRKGIYVIRNTKNKRYMRKKEKGVETLPAPMLAHLREYADARGGAWAHGEEIFDKIGKSDGTVSNQLQGACRRASLTLPSELPKLCMNDLRRSFCTALFMSGVSESKAVYFMGHQSADMVRKVYRQHLRETGEVSAAFGKAKPIRVGGASVTDIRSIVSASK